MSVQLNRTQRAAIVGALVGLLTMLLTVQLAFAAPPRQSGDGESAETLPEDHPVQGCQECHLDITNSWIDSPHAHAYDDKYFQEQWAGLGEPGECLTCHTTEYDATTGEYISEGVACIGCHGETPDDHPPSALEIRADTDFCGTCHTTTHSEWRLTGHFSAEIGCTDCHDPHNQQPLFEEPDDLCINCHEDDMGDYLEDMHIEEGIGCVDCHALVIPPDEIPQDGIVPTGHAFTISAATCVACHTDSLHAGFSLPGYESGAKNVSLPAEDAAAGDAESAEAKPEVVRVSPEQQIETLEAALASQNTTLIFQGAIVGLVLGGTTAWYVARNTRGQSAEDEEEAVEQSDDG
jgi:predicted CXXCH cytochrome family protein